MSQETKHVAAIFKRNPHALKEMVQKLEQLGFHDISVLALNQEESEVRMYSPTVYPAPVNHVTGISHHAITSGGQLHPRMSQRTPELEHESTDPTLRQAALDNDTREIDQRSGDDGHIQDVIESDQHLHQKDIDALLKGSSLGLIIGGIAGAGALMIPGLGPVLYAGSALGAILSGGAVGMGIGAIVGALQDKGLPSDLAQQYRDALKRENMIVIVDINTMAPDTEVGQAEGVFKQFDAERIDHF